MKIAIPKEMQKRETLGDALEVASLEALQDKIDSAYQCVSDWALKMAFLGHYGMSIKHSDIAEHIGVITDGTLKWIIKHVEDMLVEDGVQVAKVKSHDDKLSIHWGIAKLPEGDDYLLFHWVRG